MYLLRSHEHNQMNIAAETPEKPGIDTGIHWLNPLYKNADINVTYFI